MSHHQDFNDSHLLQVIEDIYAYGFDHQNWDKPLEGLCRLLRAKSGGLFFLDHKKRIFRALGVYNISEEYIEKYKQLGALDATATVMIPLPEGAARAAIDHNVSRTEHVDFYDKILLKANLGYIAALNICNHENYFVGIGIHRGMESEQFSKDEVKVLERLYSHFRRVFETADILERLKQKEAILVHLLSKVPLGIVLVDAFLKVHYQNDLAYSLMKHDLGLSISKNNSLLGADTESLKRLKSLVIQAAEDDGKDVSVHHSPILFPSLNEHPLSVTIAPSPVESSLYSPDLVPLYISHPLVASFVSVEMLQAIYPLTKAEAEIVILLLGGSTLNDITSVRGSSKQTVRSQLKSIFSKLNVSSQQELIRYLITGSLNLVG
ncbi:helix-turn-helix transcriptional regulator [Marinomonas balearica]|uniref:Regulatory LuxR family protein n=1 Tax=Marinomonas balearica TaxID=491947 RepID=A0A4R6M5R2_9GAMM|nr:LuxR C-terminal-related transcriptional regulator [Marinomonas balearica]TDO95890.1 regulatory LuxR family protein [Marinomonas balearica]